MDEKKFQKKSENGKTKQTIQVACVYECGVHVNRKLVHKCFSYSTPH